MPARLVLTVSIIGNLGILCLFKYTDFMLAMLNSYAGASFKLLKLTLPIGISFYTFQTMSYTIDVYRGKVAAQNNLISFGMYVCMFPQLIAGPIVRYSDVQKEIDKRRESLTLCAAGLQRFLIGFGKKVFFANQIGALWDEIYGLPQSEMSALLAWLGAICYMFQIYFDFSGYSDMAIGLGKMFGFHFPENFDYPYEAKSITEFWRRWHMTLGTWFREYLYIPLGGNKRGMPRQILNLFIVWSLTGLWHGAGWNFLLWGLYFFALLVAEKFLLSKLLVKMPTFFQHVYVIFFILAGWVIFACDNLASLKTYLKMLFAVGVPVANTRAFYEWSNHALFLAILAVASTSMMKKAAGKILQKTQARAGETTAFWMQSIWCLAVFALSMALLVSGSYNPFLYFRF